MPQPKLLTTAVGTVAVVGLSTFLDEKFLAALLPTDVVMTLYNHEIDVRALEVHEIEGASARVPITLHLSARLSPVERRMEST